MLRNWVPILGIILVATALACNLPGIGDGAEQQPTEEAVQAPDAPAATLVPPPEASEFSLEEIEAALGAPVVDDRPEVLSYLGRPDAFSISIVTVDSAEIRLESWRYYQFGTRVDFVDGEATLTVEIDPAPDGAILPAWFDPMAFQAGMTGEQAAQAAEDASPAGARVEEIDLASGGEDLAGGRFLVGDQIVIGIQDNRLVYVETVGQFPQGGEG